MNKNSLALSDWYVDEKLEWIINQIAIANVQNVLNFIVKKGAKNSKNQSNHINSCQLRTTPIVIIMVCRIKAEFVWISHFLRCWWSFELESFVHIEGAFFFIATFSINKCSKKFRLFRWWRSYNNVFVFCLTVFDRFDINKPFCVIEIDWHTSVFGLWSDEWTEILNQNRKLDSSLCWLLQNFWRCQMANF